MPTIKLQKKKKIVSKQKKNIIGFIWKIPNDIIININKFIERIYFIVYFNHKK